MAGMDKIKFNKYTIFDREIELRQDTKSEVLTATDLTDIKNEIGAKVLIQSVKSDISEALDRIIEIQESLARMLSGVWKWNDVLNYNEVFGVGWKQPINFTSNGGTYSLIGEGGGAIYYGDVSNYVCAGAWGDIADAAYQYIDFGAIPQDVSEEFYIMFTNNATKQ